MRKSGQFLTVTLAAVCMLAPVGLAETANNDAVSVGVCIATNNGLGTANMPPISCEYVGPTEYHRLKNVLTGEELMKLKIRHGFFANITANPGGTLGGEVEIFNSRAEIEAVGVGPLEGFQRFITVPLVAETHTGPRVPGEPVQDFETQMYRLEGAIAGDGDFELLEITAGEAFGLPSPGHTTLTYQEDTDTFWVDSFFDVHYQIEYVGAAGSQLEGYAGTSEDALTVTAVAASADADVADANAASD